ncbi:hypothetical protein DFP72DRAFT_823995, partial [Ephemerocybe angulata]
PMAVGIFLCSMDGTIVVSSYAAIGSELNQLHNTSWIATSYLLTVATFHIVSIIVSDVVPLRSRGTWQGVLNIIWASGNATGASLGGYLADTIGWRWAFLLQVPIALIAFAAAGISLRLPTMDSGDFYTKLRRVDFLGAVTLISTIFALLLGLDRGGNVGWTDPIARYSLSAFVFFASIFAFVEMEWAKEPFAPKRIIVNRSLIASYLVNFFGIAASFAVIFHIPLYLQAVQEKTASQASLWLILAVLGAVFGCVV